MQDAGADKKKLTKAGRVGEETTDNKKTPVRDLCDLVLQKGWALGGGQGKTPPLFRSGLKLNCQGDLKLKRVGGGGDSKWGKASARKGNRTIRKLGRVFARRGGPEGASSVVYPG